MSLASRPPRGPRLGGIRPSLNPPEWSTRAGRAGDACVFMAMWGWDDVSPEKRTGQNTIPDRMSLQRCGARRGTDWRDTDGRCVREDS